MFVSQSTLLKDQAPQSSVPPIRQEESMPYSHQRFGGDAGEELHIRETGRFYTPPVISSDLIEQICRLPRVRSLGALRVVDPFCGDGRLIVELLRVLAQTGSRVPLSIDLWDCDGDAVRKAAHDVRSAADEFGIRTNVAARTVDSFEHSRQFFGQYDLVITNPPWEALKPDRRELKFLSESRRTAHIQTLRFRDSQLASWYPLSQPARKFSGWGTNLARVGAEITLRLCHPSHGICGVISPASLLGDQVSAKLREWLFTKFTVSQISFFPAEGRFFQGVDQPVITLIVCAGVQGGASVFRNFDKSGRQVATRDIDTSQTTLERSQYTIPIQFGPAALNEIGALRGLPIFANLEGDSAGDLWAGRELDETGRTRYLVSRGRIRFAKGQMVTRYATSETPKFFVNAASINIPASVSHLRIGWRDVSRPTQKRRMQASLIPENWVTGNSLHVAYFKDDNHQRLMALLGLLNSAVFELQVRARLATAHVSLGAVRQAHLPELTSPSLVKALASHVRRCLRGDRRAHIEAEVAVAKAYGLGRNAFGRILDLFPKLEAEEKEQMLAAGIWG